MPNLTKKTKMRSDSLTKENMLPFSNSQLYKEFLNTLEKLAQEKGSEEFMTVTKEKCFAINENIANALQQSNNKEQYQKHIDECKKYIIDLISICQLAARTKCIDAEKAELFEQNLELLYHKASSFKQSQKRILILTAKMGQGHISAAKALKDGLEAIYGFDYAIEIVDFMELINSFISKVSQKSYESSTKYIPQIYKLFFESTDTKWPVKLLNQINYPFVLTKIKNFFEEAKPNIVISTFPIWDYLASEIWKKTEHDTKFISVVTDSISIHNTWAVADVDYHIVANQDTALSLKKLGIKEDKIKTLGFPVRLDFLRKTDKEETLKKHHLDPKKYTVLYLPTAQNPKTNIKILNELSQNQNYNIIVITGRDATLRPIMEKAVEKLNNKNITLIGWTDKMSDYIKSSDVIITKAGGATVMECIAAEKPMIITSIIPGQEEGNGELIKRYQLGIIPAETKMSIAESVDYIHKHQKQFSENLKKHSNPEAAIKIAEFINSLFK